MCVDGLLPANLCVVALNSSEECLKFESFRLQHIQIVNKTPSYKTKSVGNNAPGEQS